ncbi:protein-L-isoaspartate(D-aspartate) O-methyltransferase [Faunimonas sp. B44]|uniref:protein-L-isoaspartate(D-aspartate) O-methyltransferase n=1 Tax=Faunimonas sp. B44 TaxID=3461493 RepID=UPI0040440972
MNEPIGTGALDDEERVRMASLILSLRGLGVSDRRLLKAIETIPRGLFVPDGFRARAYDDCALPIACGQSISAPSVIGTIVAALELGDRHSVLEIGTGSGYQAAILSRLARRVTTIERYRTLARAAEARWAALRISNITGIVADGAPGWPRQAPFDRIVVNAAAAGAPSRLIAQLSETGILVAPVGPQGGPQRLTLFQRRGDRVDTRDLGAARFPPIEAGIAPGL